MKKLPLLLLSTILLNYLNCRIQPTQQQTTGLNKNERLSSGQTTEPSKNTDTRRLSDSLKAQNNTTQQETKKQEEQTEAPRNQDLADNFITPINMVDKLNQSIKSIDTKLKNDIKARTKKNRYATTKDLTTKAQAKKAATYTQIIAKIQQLLADTDFLPTRIELQQSLYHNTALKLGNVIQALIKNVCEQPKNTTKMIIKKEYQGAIQRTDFLAMIAKAAEFSRGFSTQQNNDIKRALTMLAQSKIPVISK